MVQSSTLMHYLTSNRIPCLMLMCYSKKEQVMHRTVATLFNDMGNLQSLKGVVMHTVAAAS